MFFGLGKAGCVRRGAEFVLVTDTQIYRFHNQQLPELTAFANQRVKVEGRVEDGRILVGKMTIAALDKEMLAKERQIPLPPDLRKWAATTARSVAYTTTG